MKNEGMGTVGDISGKDLINQIQWTNVLFSSGDTSSLGLNWGDVAALLMAAEDLVALIRADINKLPPNSKADLERGMLEQRQGRAR